MPRRTLVPVLAALLILPACGARRADAPEAAAATTTVEVENQTMLDMTIYVVSAGGQRVRLGLVNAQATATFPLPDRLVPGMALLRFQTDPVGGEAEPLTQEILVSRGDTVVVRIPPY